LGDAKPLSRRAAILRAGIPLAWVLLGISRRGKSLLPTRAEFKGDAPVLAANA
jgi:hypothetical protein